MIIEDCQQRNYWPKQKYANKHS